MQLALYYLKGDVAQAKPKDPTKSKKYEELTQGSIDDAVTKIVKLLANLSTEEEYALK